MAEKDSLTYRILKNHLVSGTLSPGEKISIRVDSRCLSIDVIYLRPADTFPAGLFLKINHQDNQGTGVGRNPDGFGDEGNLLHLGDNQSQGFGCACGG